MLKLRTNNYPVVSNSNSLFNVMDDIFNDSFFKPTTAFNSFNESFKIDVKNTEEAYVVEAQLPGVEKESVELEYKDNRLYISVAKNETKEEENDGYVYKESRNEAMHRAVFLKNIDPSKISAKLEAGILTVEAPKTIVEKDQFKIDIN